MNLGQFIKKRREEKNMSQEQLANLIGKNKNFISRLENNKVKSLKDNMIEPLAEALSVPIWALFDGFDETGKKIEYEKISKEDFLAEVTLLLNKTENLTDQQKQYLLSNLEFICSDEK